MHNRHDVLLHVETGGEFERRTVSEEAAFLVRRRVGDVVVEELPPLHHEQRVDWTLVRLQAAFLLYVYFVGFVEHFFGKLCHGDADVTRSRKLKTRNAAPAWLVVP